MDTQLIKKYTDEAKHLTDEKLFTSISIFSGNCQRTKMEVRIKYLCRFEEYQARGLPMARFKRLNCLVDFFDDLKNTAIDDSDLDGDTETHKSRIELDHHVAIKYISLRDRSKKKGMDFNLSLDDIKALMSATVCQYTGEKICRFGEDGDRLTIDRLDNRKGYIKGNVFAVSHSANQYKNIIIEAPSAPLFERNLPRKELIIISKLMLSLSNKAAD